MASFVTFSDGSGGINLDRIVSWEDGMMIGKSGHEDLPCLFLRYAPETDYSNGDICFTGAKRIALLAYLRNQGYALVLLSQEDVPAIPPTPEEIEDYIAGELADDDVAF